MKILGADWLSGYDHFLKFDSYKSDRQNACAVKPGSHQRQKHKQKIDTKTKHDLSSGTCKYKTTRIFLWFVFCSALGLCFDYVLMVVLMSLYMSQALLHSFVFPFVCPYAYAASVKQALSLVFVSARIVGHFE